MVDKTELEKVLVSPKPKSVWDLKRGDECFYMFGGGTGRGGSYEFVEKGLNDEL